MTQQEFFELLKQTPRKWALKDFVDEDIPAMLRMTLATGEDCCPITAVALQKGFSFYALGEAGDVGRKLLSLDDIFIDKVITSADNWKRDASHFDPVLRTQLIEACGLTEV